MSQSSDSQTDFATLLEESLHVERVTRGDILTGTILAIDGQGIIVDVGMKRDGVVPRTDLDSLGDCEFEVGDTVMVMVVRTEDNNGNLIVSLHQAEASKDWKAAHDQMTHGVVVEGVVESMNRGGLIVPYGRLRGFVPASHIIDMPRGLDEEARQTHLSSYLGKQMALKIIEVNPKRRRLVFSQREALLEVRSRTKSKLMETLKEGDIVHGVVSGMREFGAFVDMGGADGLIHISELSWRRIQHPAEVVEVGQELDVVVLRLDREGMRIGLSLKRLNPNPWKTAEDDYHVGQVVEGIVSRMVSFGAFVVLETGIEALLHVSHISDPPPHDPAESLVVGQKVTTQIINLEPHRQRMGLSLKSLSGEIQAHVDAAQPPPDGGLAGGR
jgi:small subunit ribosomal protein S1